MRSKEPQKESVVVKIYLTVFANLIKIIPYEIFKAILNHLSKQPRIDKRNDMNLVEAWVLSAFILSFALSSHWHVLPPILQYWKPLIVFLAGYRVFGVVVYQINVLLFSWYTRMKTIGKYEVRGYLRILLLLLHNYVEIALWFTIFYRHISGAFHNGTLLHSFLTSLNYSFVTMTSFGYTKIYPINDCGLLLTLIQSAIGVFMTLLILTRFVSLIPKPKTSDSVEKKFEEK